jgi:hypothetical protein
MGYYGEGMTISSYDIRTDQVAVVRNLSARLKTLFGTGAARAWTKQEGRPSSDGKLWCLQVENSGFGMLGLVAYDFVNDQILGSMATTDRPDHVSASPLGDRCVPSWVGGSGTRAYTTNFASFTQLHTTSEHSDLALTKSGAEVYVFTDYGSGDVAMVDLNTGVRTNLFSLYGTNFSATAMHISGTSMKKPGYVTIGFYGCSETHGSTSCNPATQWFKDKIVVVELVANPKIYNLAHTHYGDAGYFAESQSVANGDLSKVLFVSTWHSTLENDVESYMINIPAGSLP